MISINNVTVSFGGFTLYDGISFLINQRDRIGLAGKNGAGKSTLLKIIVGEQRPTSGDIAIPKDCTIGYLKQDMATSLGKTVFDETATAFAEVRKLEEKINWVNEQLTTRTDYESDGYMQLIQDLNDANERLNVLDGGEIDAQIEQALMGLGFERKDFGRLTDEFSGGWRMRIELAKILLQKPNVLLLDEPTNHLDIESIQWLETFLIDYYGAVVIISHDKAFLDNLTTRTIEISLGQIHDYRANYSKYLSLRKERRDTQMAAHKNQQKFIEKTEQLIDKYRAKANKASFAQSLIKKLDKLDIIEVDNEDNQQIRFRFPPAPRSGKVVVEAKDATKAYGDKIIFHDVNFEIEREDRIAFVGRNGEGKSTMIRMINGESATKGHVKPGFSVSIGYFAQDDADMMDPDKTVFETIDELAVGDMRKQVRGLLGSFLFSGDDTEKKVKVLSGGERTRLALCKLLLHPNNLLVLDEPTNHLDIRSKDVLKNALLKYDGTLVIVSHDRDFLQGLTNKVFEFRNGNVKQHIGDVYEFIKTRKIEHLSELEVKATAKVVAKAAVKAEENSDSEEYRAKQKEINHIKNRIHKIEGEITKLEKDILAIDDQLNDPEKYQAVMNDKELFRNYEKMKDTLDVKMKEWEELNKKL
ncbi:MAG TPA: ABC-F family ATP-binding cassette domain-containing protein [Bacteroidia bacterium]|jgi:ATP-binding cassette subfamily F protein 3|nr:ABC-F family ATP-binding cassette domain-containing protein [Bacteroidia bacterium]